MSSAMLNALHSSNSYNNWMMQIHATTIFSLFTDRVNLN